MNTKAFQAQQFAIGHYSKLLKVRPAIKNSLTKRNQVPFTSRNLTHMARYEQQIKTNKLVKKLVEIQKSNYSNKYLSNSHKKRGLNKKDRKLTFSQNKSYQNKKTLVSPFRTLQIKNKISGQNIILLDKFFINKSVYSQAFAKDRLRKLKNYSQILKQSKGDYQIRDQYFQAFQKFKFASQKVRVCRPTSTTFRYKNKKSQPQTARPTTPN